jgi:hypothetical protein
MRHRLRGVPRPDKRRGPAGAGPGTTIINTQTVTTGSSTNLAIKE